MNELHGRGYDHARELASRTDTDWKFGGLSQPSLVSIPESERAAYLPIGELQMGAEDFMSCASIGPLNYLEALFTYFYQTNMHPDNKKWIEEKGYLQGGRITFSDRFVAIGSQTTRNGNSLKEPLHAIYSQGCIPKVMLPKRDDMTFDQYHNKGDITQEMIDLGAEFARRFTINYEQVAEIHFPEVLKDEMLDVAAYSWPTPVNGVYPRTIGNPNHVFLLYGLPAYQAYDSYEEAPGDWTKNLASDYDFFDTAYRVFISKEDPNATPKLISLYQQLLDVLKKIYELVR